MDRKLVEEWQLAITNFILPIKTFGNPADEASDRLVQLSLQIVETLKGVDLVSKSLISELWSLPLLIRSELPYRDDRDKLSKVADDLERCFFMVMADEVPSDRTPGKPRII